MFHFSIFQLKFYHTNIPGRLANLLTTIIKSHFRPQITFISQCFQIAVFFYITFIIQIFQVDWSTFWLRSSFLWCSGSSSSSGPSGTSSWSPSWQLTRFANDSQLRNPLKYCTISSFYRSQLYLIILTTFTTQYPI
jgi:hypothetical protein